MHILITGAAGFIGSFLSKRLLELGHSVTGIDNINEYYPPKLKYARLNQLGIDAKGADFGIELHSNLFPSFSFLKMSIEDREGLARLFEEKHFDCAINLAAQAGVRYSLPPPTRMWKAMSWVL